MKSLKRIFRFKKFTRWMNYNPPGAMTSKGWRLFNNEFKERAPIRYWFHRDFRKLVIYPIKWKYEEIGYWIRFRTYDRLNILHTGLKPDFYNAHHRILHANFNVLKDLVESEYAWNMYCGDRGERSFCEEYLPFYRIFNPYRNPEKGIEYLEWAATLDDPALPMHDRSDRQAVDAREIHALYNWWVIDRPNRKEVEVCGYGNQELDSMSFLDSDFNKDAEDYKQHLIDYENREKQQKEWDAEDLRMLHRFIDVSVNF